METRLDAVRRILDAAANQGTPGNPNHQGLGRFWNLPLDQFKTCVVYGQQVIVPSNPDTSALIKALKGTAPFDGTMFPRMPLGRPPVKDSDIAFIAKWITDGCPATDPKARN